MFISWVEPVGSLVELIFIKNKPKLFVNLAGNVSIVNTCTERSVETLDPGELVVKDELSDEATWPRILQELLCVGLDRFWEGTPEVPLLFVPQHVGICHYWITLRNFDIFFSLAT